MTQSIISIMVSLPPVRTTPLDYLSPEPEEGTTGIELLNWYREQRRIASHRRIVEYLEDNGPSVVSKMADDLGYTVKGLRIMLKKLEALNKVEIVGTEGGYKNRRVIKWGAVAQEQYE